jgi:hypothetical protein
MTADAGLVFLPRFTTLVGDTEFITAPLDVSGHAGTQFQVWRGPIRVSSGTPTLSLYIEESLDTYSWALGPSTPQGILLLENATQFFSYSFRLRWFRLRLALDGTNPMVSCWAEGILRAGDGGMWGVPGINPLGPAGMVSDRPGTDMDPWAKYKAMTQRGPMPWENPTEFLRQLEAERRRVTFDWASSHGGVAPPPPNVPGWVPPWVSGGAIPVTPPQLGLGKGP